MPQNVFVNNAFKSKRAIETASDKIQPYQVFTYIFNPTIYFPLLKSASVKIKSPRIMNLPTEIGSFGTLCELDIPAGFLLRDIDVN